MQLDKSTLPHSIESEKASLGSMLLNSEAVAYAVDKVNSQDYHEVKNRHVFDAIKEAYNADRNVDVVTVSEYMQHDNAEDYLNELVASTPSPSTYSDYISIVQDKAQLRDLIKTGDKLQELGYTSQDTETAIDQAESMVFQMSQVKSADRIVKISDKIEGYKDKLRERARNPDRITGLATHYRDLDMILGGFQDSDLIIQAGRPSMGKTALALNCANNICKDVHEDGSKKKVTIFSLEMSTEQLIERLVCAEANISAEKMRAGQLDRDEWKKVGVALDEVKSWDLEIDDTPNLTVGEIRAKLRRSHAEKPIDFVIIDYLGLIGDGNTTGGENRSTVVGQKTKALKGMARELDTPILLLSQLNRGVEQREDKRPMMSDLRESGAIEQDADVVIMLYRDEYYNADSPAKNIAEVIINKHRKGSNGTIELAFLKEYTKFVNLDYRR
ncbi:replicative DNA helicase (plasmid) [Halobacillus litoralis]|uniref:replicative DNA helicase n=1 Tax=Halobacillus litoralis TaxID=45668 RepID=UPI001CFDA2F5|nr:replicative DNA helicase [Halobacillus litoralis]WLR49611.1 replicative DNA helicase [Halobacillus litoralis]